MASHAETPQMPAKARQVSEQDMALVAGGLVGGAATGATVAILIEGMPIGPTPAEKQAEYTAQTQDGTPPMVEPTPLQEGTIAGLTLVGVAIGVLAARWRHRQNG